MTIKEFVSASLQNFHSVISGIYQKKNDIVDNLSSTDTTNPLSANQGKVLKDHVDTINSKLGEIKKISNPLLYLGNTIVTFRNGACYILFFWQTGAWDLNGIAYLTMSGYSGGSKYYFITGSDVIKSSLSVTIDTSTGDVTFNNQCGCQFRMWIYQVIST